MSTTRPVVKTSLPHQRARCTYGYRGRHTLKNSLHSTNGVKNSLQSGG